MSRKLWVWFLHCLKGVHREVALQRPLLAASALKGGARTVAGAAAAARLAEPVSARSGPREEEGRA